jgi:hypothetical protein
MKPRAKVNYLIRGLEQEQMEVEHCYELLKTNIRPDGGTTEAHYRVEAMKNLSQARTYIAAAVEWLNQMYTKEK